jgi:hypothetical protein
MHAHCTTPAPADTTVTKSLSGCRSRLEAMSASGCPPPDDAAHAEPRATSASTDGRDFPVAADACNDHAANDSDVPPFLCKRVFALPSTSSTAAAVARRSHAAVAAFAAHGTAIALVAALLRAAAVHPRLPARLPKLRAALRRALGRGVAENARLRARLRRCVARVVFAGAEEPPDSLRRAHHALERLTTARAARCRDTASVLRAVIKAARQVLHDARVQSAQGELLPRVWENLDHLLYDAVERAEARHIHRGRRQVEKDCTAIVQAGADVVRSSEITLSFDGLKTADRTESFIMAVHDGRCGVRVRAHLSVRRVQSNRLHVENRLENIGESDVFVLGIHLVPPGDTIPIRAHLPTFRYPPKIDILREPATIIHATILSTSDVDDDDGKIAVAWYLHSVTCKRQPHS